MFDDLKYDAMWSLYSVKALTILKALMSQWSLPRIKKNILVRWNPICRIWLWIVLALSYIPKDQRKFKASQIVRNNPRFSTIYKHLSCVHYSNRFDKLFQQLYISFTYLPSLIIIRFSLFTTHKYCNII